MLNGDDGWNEMAQQLDDFQIGVVDPADVKRLEELRAFPEFFDTSPGGSTRASTGVRAICTRALPHTLACSSRHVASAPVLGLYLVLA